MAQDDLQARLTENPKFRAFVSTRNTYSIIMAIIGAIAYYGFILLVAFDRQILAAKLGTGMVTSVGVPLGVGVIVFTIILTWIYVRRCNSEFDVTTAELLKEAKQ